MHNLDEISRLRKKLGISQSELSELSGVSQSLIAKLEAKKIDPSYTKVKQLLETLERHNRRSSKKAKEIANKNVVQIKSTSNLKQAADIMHKKSISQLPVYKGNVITGSISERTILKILSESKSPEDAFKKKVIDIMEDPFPVISGETSIELVYEMLDFFDAIMITKKEEIKGIITKNDLLKLG